jgi:hypothetical protein
MPAWVACTHARAWPDTMGAIPKIAMPDLVMVSSGGQWALRVVPFVTCSSRQTPYDAVQIIRGAADLQQQLLMRPDPVFDAVPGSGRALQIPYRVGSAQKGVHAAKSGFPATCVTGLSGAFRPGSCRLVHRRRKRLLRKIA